MWILSTYSVLFSKGGQFMHIANRVDYYIVKCTYLVIFKINDWGAICFCFVHTAEHMFLESMLTLRLHNWQSCNLFFSFKSLQYFLGHCRPILKQQQLTYWIYWILIEELPTQRCKFSQLENQIHWTNSSWLVAWQFSNPAFSRFVCQEFQPVIPI